MQTLFNMLITDEHNISLLVTCHLTVLLEYGPAGVIKKNQLFVMARNYASTH